MIAHWSRGQEKWYLGKGVKKYPTVCMDAKKATYYLVYSSEEKTVDVTGFQRVGGGSGTITDNSGTPVGSVQFPGADIPYQTTEQRSTVYLYVFTSGDTPFLSGGQSNGRALQVFTRTSVQGTLLGMRDPYRGVLEDAIRFLANTAAAEVTNEAEGRKEKSQSGPTGGAYEAPGSVAVASSPEGAEIYADDAFVGNAPATLKLKPGKHTIRLASTGYKDWSREITVQSGSDVHLTATLEKQN